MGQKRTEQSKQNGRARTEQKRTGTGRPEPKRFSSLEQRTEPREYKRREQTELERSAPAKEKRREQTEQSLGKRYDTASEIGTDRKIYYFELKNLICTVFISFQKLNVSYDVI